MMYEKLSPKQLKSMLWWAQPDSKNYDAIVCDGSVRSGKTMSMTVGFVLWSVKNFDNENFAFCGKTIDSLKRNVITLILSIILDTILKKLKAEPE